MGRAQEPLALAGSLLAAPFRVGSGHRDAAVRGLGREQHRVERGLRVGRQIGGHIDALDRDTKGRSRVGERLKPVVHGGQQRLTDLAAQRRHGLCAVVGVLLVAGLDDDELVEPAARRHAHRRGSKEAIERRCDMALCERVGDGIRNPVDQARAQHEHVAVAGQVRRHGLRLPALRRGSPDQCLRLVARSGQRRDVLAQQALRTR